MGILEQGALSLDPNTRKLVLPTALLSGTLTHHSCLPLPELEISSRGETAISEQQNPELGPTRWDVSIGLPGTEEQSLYTGTFLGQTPL